MGMSTLHTSNIKGFALEFAHARRVDWALLGTEQGQFLNNLQAYLPFLRAVRSPRKLASTPTNIEEISPRCFVFFRLFRDVIGTQDSKSRQSPDSPIAVSSSVRIWKWQHVCVCVCAEHTVGLNCSQNISGGRNDEQQE